ncbi:hypothetical protein CAEBREN_13286 [Caenorhabditis brenneri]|uniref:Uncharacterized protein n=1 Tax=Caenorhabditis brenneri TaxID=135651 RepID=G0NU41_CAEBE|nr:hypothetical protein CAEBREN_13286 [Caenorhabditis brenneri]
MSHYRLSDCGLYRQTIEVMLYGTPTTQDVQEQFNDSVLQRKTKKVSDLILRFDKNMVVDDLTVEVKDEDKEQLKNEMSEIKLKSMESVTSSKTKCRVPTMESFVAGILRTSSPIPEVKNETSEIKTDQLVELTETPILPYRPTKLGVNFDVLNSGVHVSKTKVTSQLVKSNPLKPQSEATKACKSSIKSEGRTKVAEEKPSTRPSKVTLFKKETPDSAYNSPGSSGSTPDSIPPQEQEFDVFLKLARSQLHKTIEEYTAWKPEILRPIAISAASLRLKALKRVKEHCHISQKMVEIYGEVASGKAKNEMNTIIVSIFHLLDEQVHVERISVLEEYTVLKYCNKTIQ